MKPTLLLLIFIALLAAITHRLIAPAAPNAQPHSDRQRFPHWHKLDATGTRLDARDGPWACVVDSNTGLVWENKSRDEGIHAGVWTYSWIDSDGWQKSRHRVMQTPQGSCAGLDHCNTAALVERANTEHWCGFNDWRIPELEELQTLLDTSYPPPGPLVCPCFLSNTARSSYWSNTTDRYRQRLGLNFRNGDIKTFPEHASLYLRLVRGDHISR